MPENKLPGLSGKSEAELRSFYAEHFGHDAAPELSTKPLLTQAIKTAWAAKYPDADASDDDAGKPAAGAAYVAAAEAEVAEGFVRLVNKHDGRVKDLPESVVKLLGGDYGDYEKPAAKPETLKPAAK